MILKISKKVISIFLALSLIMTSCLVDMTKCFADDNAIKCAEQTIDNGFYDLTVELFPGIRYVNVVSGNTDQVKTAINSQYIPYQKFYVYFDEKSKGYKIRSLYTGKYLGVRKVDDVDSQRITQNELSEDYYQDWMIQEEYGEYVLRLKTEPGQFRYLSVLEKEFIYPTSKENIARTFKLYKADFNVDFSSGMCEITSPALFGVDTTYGVLDTTTVDKDTGLGLKPSNRNGYANQKFFIEYHADTNDYTIMSMYPKMFLGVEKNAEGQSYVICNSVAENMDKFRWLIRKDSGFFYVTSKFTGESLEINEAGLILTSANSESKGQKFEFSNIKLCVLKANVIIITVRLDIIRTFFYYTLNYI